MSSDSSLFWDLPSYFKNFWYSCLMNWKSKEKSYKHYRVYKMRVVIPLNPNPNRPEEQNLITKARKDENTKMIYYIFCGLYISCFRGKKYFALFAQDILGNYLTAQKFPIVGWAATCRGEVMLHA